MSEPLIYRVVNPRGPEGFVQSVVYVNLCVERTNYTPIPLERIQQMVRGIDVH
jgi:hypothetical protein